MNARLLLLLASLLGLGGCSLLGPQNVPEVSTYTLAVERIHSPVSSHQKITLAVNTPTAGAGYDTRKMIFTNRPYELGEFARSQWAAPPAEMIEPILIQKLRDTGRFHAVVMNAFSTNKQLSLRTHLIELRQDFTVKPSQVKVAIQAELINANDNKVINSRTFTTSISAPENTPYSGVVAANKAVDWLLTQIAEFSVRSLNSAQHESADSPDSRISQVSPVAKKYRFYKNIKNNIH